MAKTQTRLFLVSGDDLDQIRQRGDELVRQCSGGANDPFSLDVFKPQEGKDPSDLLTECLRSLRTPSFFGAKTVGLLEFPVFEKEPAKSKLPAEKEPARTKTGKEKESAKSKAGSDLSPVEKLLAELAAFVDELPENLLVVISGPDIDKRKSLFKICQAKGEVEILEKPKVTDRKWQENMGAYIVGRAQAKGLELEPGVVEFLSMALGTETGRVDNELEKLSIFVAGRRIPLKAAQELVAAEGESIVWSLTSAVGDRKADTALAELNTLLGMPGGNDDSKIITFILALAGFLRQLLQIRILMRLRKLTRPEQFGDAIERMDDTAREEFADSGLSFFANKLHPYRAKILAKQALNYSEIELQEAISCMRDLNLASVSSSADRRAMLEEAILRIAAPPFRRRR